MSELIEKENILIEDMIYEVRGVQVMLDSDLLNYIIVLMARKTLTKQ